MFQAKMKIVGTAPLSYSRYLMDGKRPNEKEDARDERLAPKKAHVDDDGNCVFPGIWLKTALASTAQYMGLKIPGGGAAKYAKHFLSGILCPEDQPLLDKKGRTIAIKNVEIAAFPCDAQGNKGGRGGHAVVRRFPMIPPGWNVQMQVVVVDEVICEDIFKRTLDHAGLVNGFGRYRPQNGGTNGRFTVEDFSWSVI